MTQQVQEAVVRQSITVAVPIDRAFHVFTAGFNGWWPREHHIGAADLAVAVLEGRLHGRLYERSVDGSECEWGRVLAWDPPHHVALAWQINPQWKYDPDINRASRVDVRFVPAGPDATRVDLEHSGFERHGEGWENVFETLSSPGAWGGVLQRYAAAATEG